MIRTLIVEDERLFRESLKKKIGKYRDFEVISTAKNGLEGQLEIEKVTPNVIFTDVRMPGQDGLDFLSEIRAKFQDDILVVFISGYPNFDYARRAIQLGAFDYLTKPILEGELLNVINRIRDNQASKGEKNLSFNDDESPGDLIEAAKQWIHNNLKDVTLDGTATYVRMNSSSFSRKFKQETGITFIQYLTKVRIDFAKRLLKNPLIKISEISYTVGYLDQQHFTRTFKKTVGLSPEEYRTKS
jgi:two-component system response regulator YesN